MLQNKNINPALMVAGYQPRVGQIELFEAFNVPLNRLDKTHPKRVYGNPRFSNPVHSRTQAALCCREWQNQF